MIQTVRSTGPAYTRAKAVLRRALERAPPSISLDQKGYATSFRENLVAGTRAEDFETDLRQGDGNELASKFRAAHSSSALAINTFARFKASTDLLSIAGSSGFGDLRFEAKCPDGVVSRRPPYREFPPNLDLLLCCRTMILGVESKCTEHLSLLRAGQSHPKRKEKDQEGDPKTAPLDQPKTSHLD